MAREADGAEVANEADVADRVDVAGGADLADRAELPDLQNMPEADTTQLRYYDSHTHLNDPAYDEDREETIRRSLDAGLERMMVVGADIATSVSAVALTREYPDVLRCAVGIHPHDAGQIFDPDIEAQLTSLLDHKEENRILAFGEIGLDYFYDNTDRPTQRRAFRRQLELAHDYDLPLIIHQREAHQESIEILRQAREDGLLRERAGVIHCYSSSAELVREFRDLGFVFGFDGPVTFKNAKKFPEVLAAIELQEILVETDCPYLTPVPHRGKRNEPSYVPLVVAKLAELKGVSATEMARHCWENTLALWGD